jgi:hypothetical protein
MMVISSAAVVITIALRNRAAFVCAARLRRSLAFVSAYCSGLLIDLKPVLIFSRMVRISAAL